MTSPEETLLELKVGQQAPEFSAELYPPGKLNLKEHQGKKNVILAFYPKDDTPGCTAEMCAFSADLSQFEGKDTAVYGVSCDSLESHEKFAAKHKLTIPLVCDSSGEIAGAYGALREGRKSANRKLFIIDKNGVIKHIHDGMPKNEDLLQVLGTI